MGWFIVITLKAVRCGLVWPVYKLWLRLMSLSTPWLRLVSQSSMTTLLSQSLRLLASWRCWNPSGANNEEWNPFHQPNITSWNYFARYRQWLSEQLAVCRTSSRPYIFNSPPEALKRVHQTLRRSFLVHEESIRTRKGHSCKRSIPWSASTSECTWAGVSWLCFPKFQSTSKSALMLGDGNLCFIKNTLQYLSLPYPDGDPVVGATSVAYHIHWNAL